MRQPVLARRVWQCTRVDENGCGELVNEGGTEKKAVKIPNERSALPKLGQRIRAALASTAENDHEGVCVTVLAAMGKEVICGFKLQRNRKPVVGGGGGGGDNSAAPLSKKELRALRRKKKKEAKAAKAAAAAAAAVGGAADDDNDEED